MKWGGAACALVIMFCADNGQCDSHLINDGITMLANGSYLLEFEATGPVQGGEITTFDCSVDDGPIFSCKSL